ncbi:MAG: acyltransferase domain-containing protein [Bacteroidales bacterium]|jgi:acyl transferase domain-containing protein/acyl carrier protein|nr:acyltransferase domain-containing protein [Bacteroidales bacterium]
MDNFQKIAIIGMDCRIPGASNIDEFWQNLLEGKESITVFTKEELLEADESLKDINSPNYISRRGIVNGVDMFDAAFFGFTPREAELLDPQHRLFIECCYHALEDAGYAEHGNDIRVGVFGGAGTAWYLNDIYNNPSVRKYADGTSIVTGSDRDYLTTRVSYKFNLMGPSLDVQSACSSAMASIVLGMQSLIDYQSDMILAGGVSVTYPEKKGYLYVPGSLDSADGSCRPFDKKASGTAFSRGCGVILMKRLEDAIKDGDLIYAVIRGGAINNDGSHKVGYTAPGIEGQKQAIIEAIERAGISAEDITMVEAHGTATPVGDPIEVTSLSESFRNYTDKKQYCALGSVKSNIGHTDAASGVVSVIKTALSLKYAKIPASINYSEPNPKIDFENSPFFVNTELRQWQDSERIALVNSFGVGGTNACLVLEQPPVANNEPLAKEKPHKEHFIALSAVQKESLDQYIKNIREFVRNEDVCLEDIAYNSLIWRKHYKYRAFIPFFDKKDFLKRLETASAVKRHSLQEENRPAVFMFPGQGNQYPEMGRELYQQYSVFRSVVDECANILKDLVQFDIREILYPKEVTAEIEARLNQTEVTQPALFVTSYAQAILLRSWGIEPQYLMGHSVGEYVAAAFSGIFSLKDALKAVSLRAKIVQALPGGAMCAVLINEEDFLPLLPKTSSIGVVNYPGLCVVSGPFGDIETLERKLSEKKIFNKRLPTSHAFHSPMMEPILDDFRKVMETIPLNKPSIPIISTVTGNVLTDEQATSADYWVTHVRNTVRFGNAVTTALSLRNMVFVEVGPGQSLESAVKRQLPKETMHSVLGTMRTPVMEISDTEYLVTAVGFLWAYGITVNSEKYFENNYARMRFPLYPYNRKQYIIKRQKKTEVQAEEEKDIKNTDISQWVYLPSWKKTANSHILFAAQKDTVLKTADNSTEEQQNVYLILQDSIGIGKEMEELLKDKNAVYVQQGNRFEKQDSTHYKINPAEKNDYENLFESIKKDGIIPSHAIHLWNVTKEKQPPCLEICSMAEEIAFYSPLYLEQAFISQNWLQKIHILFVTNGVFAIGGTRVESPLKVLAIGPARVMNNEFKHVVSHLTDIDIMSDIKHTALSLLYEVQLNNYSTVALRDGERWEESFEKTAYPKDRSALPQFKENGVYVITGGTGGLGLVFAKHIASKVKATIILTYRTSLPEREKWAKYISENPTDYITEKIQDIISMEEKGSSVILFKAEVDNEKEMKDLSEYIKNKYGKITAVFHTAGSAGGGIIALKTKEMANEVLKAKTRGTLLIDKYLESDYVVYFSSVTAILGESSRVDYCGANSFIDAYSFYKNSIKPGSAYSINWDSWSKVGMAARWEETQARNRKKIYLNEKSYISGLHSISKNEVEEIYQVGFGKETEWIYKEHKIDGQWTVVGTFIIDIFARYAKDKFSSSAVIISDLYFLKPIYIDKNEHPNFRLYAMPENGKIRVNFCSLSIDKQADKWNIMATAIISKGNMSAENISIESAVNNFGGVELKSRMFRKVVITGKESLSYSDRWMNVEKKFRNKNNFIVKQTLDKRFKDDFANHIVHPSMLDVSVANIFTDLGQKNTVQENRSVFFPFHYNSIKIYKPFGNPVYSFITSLTDMDSDTKTAVFDGKIYNNNGEIIAEIDKYSLVSVGDNTGNNISSSTVVKTNKQDSESDIMPLEGVEIFDRIIFYNNGTNVVVTPYNLFRKIKENGEEKKKDDTVEEEATTYERPDLSTEYEAPSNEIEETIAKIWGQVLGIGKIGINDNFNELGGNSLLAIQTMSNISSAFSIALPIDVFKNSPTIKQLGEQIMALLMEGIDESELKAILTEK